MSCQGYESNYIQYVQQQTGISSGDNLLALVTANTGDGYAFIDQCRPSTLDQLIYLYLRAYQSSKLAKFREGERETKATQSVLAKLNNSSTRDDAMFSYAAYNDARQYDATVVLLELKPPSGVSGVYGPCPRCGTDSYKVRVKQLRSADEGSNTILTCLKCGYVRIM